MSDIKNPGFLRGSVISTPFFAHPLLPEAKDHTKMLFEITCQKVLQDSCGTEAHKDHGSVAGLGALAPLEIRPPSLVRLSLAVAERVGVYFGHYRNVANRTQRLPQVNSPKSPPTGGGPPAECCCSWGPFRLVKTEEMRSGTSKSLGLAEVCRLKTQPNRRISRFLRPIPRILLDEMAS